MVRSDPVTSIGTVQTRRASREAADRSAAWRFARAVARVEPAESVIADFATSYCGRAVRRREVPPMASAVELPGVRWSIGDDFVAEFLPGEKGPGRLIVRDFALYRSIVKRLRSRHIRVHYQSPL